MIRVEVAASLNQNGKPPTGNAVEAAIAQCVSDSVEGSFDEYPAHLKSMLRLKAVRLGDHEVQRRQDHSQVRFAFGLPPELFPVESGGLQLLVNLLAGDIFPTETLGCHWEDVNVTSVRLPDSMTGAAYDAFRKNKTSTIHDLRTKFSLSDDRPLMAFSLKPRVGLKFDEIRTMTLDVLRAGFNVVELDSRNLALRTEPIEKWIELAIEAADAGSHVTSFSPNLSVAAGQLPELAIQWVESVGPHGPVVMKIDGGLDGLSSLQSVRTLPSLSQQPIITCYPILRSQLASAIGSTTWVDLLSLCGADVIYPGGRPTFPNERRPVWGSHVDDWSRAARIYDGYIRRGWPTPTIAGGVHPGHLQACYELLGPNVAYFLGGAVALHPESAGEGAKLCVEVLEQSIQLAKDAAKAGDDYAEDLSARLLKRVESVRYPKTALNYYSPAHLFGIKDEVADVPLTYYRR